MHTIVVGASSQVAEFLIPRLIKTGHQVHGISRQPTPPSQENTHWIQADVTSPQFSIPTNVIAKTIFYLAPIWTTPIPVEKFQHAGAQHIIAFSSTNRFTRANSPYPEDRYFAKQIEKAERKFEHACQDQNLTWNLIRPTLIYGCGKDNNVTAIARFIDRFGFFPIATPGNGLRQPVHADDIATAVIATMNNPVAWNRSFTLNGGETLPYDEIVKRIFEAQNKQPRILRIPTGTLMVKFGRRFRISRTSTSLLTRMNEDHVFDNTAACQLLNYVPRQFIVEEVPSDSAT